MKVDWYSEIELNDGRRGCVEVDKIVQTAYSKSDYKDDIVKMLEVVKKHVK